MSEVLKSIETTQPDDGLEIRIAHWESTLSFAVHAVYVAQQSLDKLYRQRYEEVSTEVPPQSS